MQGCNCLLCGITHVGIRVRWTALQACASRQAQHPGKRALMRDDLLPGCCTHLRGPLRLRPDRCGARARHRCLRRSEGSRARALLTEAGASPWRPLERWLRAHRHQDANREPRQIGRPSKTIYKGTQQKGCRARCLESSSYKASEPSRRVRHAALGTSSRSAAEWVLCE